MGWSAPPWVYRCQHNNISGGLDEANMLGCGAMTRAFAARIAVRLMLFWTLPVSALRGAAAPATQGVTNEPCPPGAVVVEPGASIQAAVDRGDEGAASA